MASTQMAMLTNNEVPTQAEIRNKLAEEERHQGLLTGTAAWLSSGLAIQDAQ
jgi:hypothetical protein